MVMLRAILGYLGICDGNMEEGNLRCDANVSLRDRGDDGPGREGGDQEHELPQAIERALAHEIRRQKELLLDGGTVAQETRLWDESGQKTISMRGKEESHDYRYFPDPDLLPLVIDEEWIERVRRSLPELPEARKARFVAQHGLPAYDAGILTSDRELADYFEVCLQTFPHPKPVSNWIMGALLALLNAQGVSIGQAPIPAAALAGLLQLIESGAISAKTAKTVFDEMAASGKSARDDRRRKGTLPDQRHRRHRDGHPKRPRRQPQRGRILPGRQDQAHGLLRRRGHESHPRPGESEDGERTA